MRVELDGHATERSARGAASQVLSRPSARLGVVLGAGGMTGIAFHTGILLSLVREFGWDPSGVGALVGTSAGALTATLVALGFTGHDLAAVVSGSRHTLSETARRHDPGPLPALPEAELSEMFRRPRGRDVPRAMRYLIRRHSGFAVLQVLREGEVDLREQLGFLEGTAWPGRQLLICATDAGRPARHVLERSGMASLQDAVAASCSVPGLMSPVKLDDRALVDGGMSSPTNADVLADEDIDAVLVISPLSGDAADSWVGRACGRFARRQLRAEVKRLRQAGKVVLVVEPAGDLSSTILDASLDGGPLVEIISATTAAMSKLLAPADDIGAPVLNAV